MDLLSSLIKEKRTTSSSHSQPASKYKRRGDVSTEHSQPSTKTPYDGSSKGTKRARQDGSNGEIKEGEERETRRKLKLPVAEVKDRLRARGQPITLFGETEEQRYDRLRLVETTHHDMDGIALQGAYAMRNSFLDNRGFKKQKKASNSAAKAPEDSAEKDTGAAKDSDKNDTEKEGKQTPGLILERPAEAASKKTTSKEKHIYRFIKRMLSEWEDELEARPEEEKRKAHGKQALKTFKQCKDYIRPFLKKLKTKAVEASILYHVDKIVSLCEDRQYIEAADWYVRLAIGNSPWPIGVTMVGIHERTGRERIESSKVAHVMNDEEQRKYITSMKRIMTFCQKKYPTDHSKMLQ